MFEIADVFDAQDIRWCTPNTSIMVMDSCLDAKIVVYSAMTGKPLNRLQMDVKSGLGVRKFKNAPNSKILACGMFD